MNQIVGFQRSVVYQQAGTTRDLVTASAVLDGWPMEFCDTAGLRQTDDAIEAAGVELTAAAIAAADLAVEVIDLTQPTFEKSAGRDASRNTLRVGNKRDLIDQLPQDVPVDLAISAETGEGVDELLRRVAAACVPSPPPPGAAVPFAPACLARLKQWEAALGS